MANTVSITFQIDHDGQGRAVLKQIDQQLTGLGASSKKAGGEIDGSLATVGASGAAAAIGITLAIEALRRGALEAFEFGKAAVAAFNEANNAALGLQTVSKSVGVDPQAATDAVKNLDLVKNGLLTTAEASTALKNLLRTGFSLEQSVDLIARFGDTAAFNKQSAIAFGDAVVRTTEGIRQNLSTLADAGGLTTNLSVLQERAAIKFDELSGSTRKAGASTKYYLEFVKETNPFLGDAARKAETFAGGQDKLAASTERVLVSIGKLITESPILNDSFRELSKSVDLINVQLQDSDSQISKLVKNGSAGFAILVLGTAEMVGKLETFLNLLRDAENLISFGASEKIINFLFPDDDAVTKKVKEQADKFRKAFDEARRPKPASAPENVLPAPSKKEEKELQEAVLRFQKESLEKAKKYEEAVKNAGNEILGLQSKLQTNPIAAFYDQAAARQKDFLEKFKDIPAEMTEAFKKANKDVLALDIFKGGLSQAALLNNLILERDKLEAGLGGKTQLTEAEQARLAQLQRASLDSQLATAQKFAAQATNPFQRNLANEQILAATSDISKLTPEQIDIRLKALNDSIGFQQQIAKENFERAREQVNAQKDNTVALVAVGNRLAAVEGALTNFKEGALKIVIENEAAAKVDLGQGFISSGNGISNNN
jgi:hypothetical protein